MEYYREKRNSIYPLAKKYREDVAFIRNMIEKSIKSVDKAYDSVSMLTNTQDGEIEYGMMLQEDAKYWQGMEEAYIDEAAVSDDLSIDFLMDDYDRSYARMVNKRIEIIISAARKHYFTSMDKQCAQKVVEGMKAGDCKIIAKNGDVYGQGQFTETWEKFHSGEKLLPG